jgi:hypothetical protein
MFLDFADLAAAGMAFARFALFLMRIFASSWTKRFITDAVLASTPIDIVIENHGDLEEAS